MRQGLRPVERELSDGEHELGVRSGRRRRWCGGEADFVPVHAHVAAHEELVLRVGRRQEQAIRVVCHQVHVIRRRRDEDLIQP